VPSDESTVPAPLIDYSRGGEARLSFPAVAACLLALPAPLLAALWALAALNLYLHPPKRHQHIDPAFGSDMLRYTTIILGGLSSVLAFYLGMIARHAIRLNPVTRLGHGTATVGCWLSGLFLAAMIPAVINGQVIDWRRALYADQLKQEATALWQSCLVYAEKHGRYPPDLATVARPEIAARYVYHGADVPRSSSVTVRQLFWSRDEIPGYGRLVVDSAGRTNYCLYDGYFRHDLLTTNWQRKQLGLPPISLDPVDSNSAQASVAPTDN
jgi:hypothetical protein